MTSPVSVGAALGAAIGFAGAAVLQQESSQSAPEDKSLSVGLIIDLLSQTKWLIGVTLQVAGFGLQALALAYGPVALVQPIVATELMYAIPFAIWRRRGRPRWQDWLGIACVVSGVSTFLIVASPGPGTPDPPTGQWVLALVPAAGVAAVAVAYGAKAKGRHRAALLAAAAGIAFGVLAVLTETTTYLLGHHLGRAFTSWQLYLVIVVGIVAMVVSQSAYQAAPLAYSLPVTDVLEPVVAVVLGDTVLNEQVRLSTGLVALEVVAAAVACVGISLLATSTTVHRVYKDA